MRPVGLEPTAFCSGGKEYSTHRFLFNTMVSADKPQFGPFAVNWVGIWVGVSVCRLGQVVTQGLVVREVSAAVRI